MCLTCGCSDADSVRITNVNHRTRDHGHDHSHGHDHGHAAGPAHADDTATRLVTIEQDLLAKNDDLAAYNRGWLAERDMAALNLMSSPGAGKTSLLERTIREAPAGRTLCVIEGDQETLFDADRIRATGAPVVQINTGAGCHLDADMLHRGLVALDPPEGSLLFVENVGNLVCPALFDLGEAAKVVIISDRGRRQAVEVSAHVRRGGSRHHQQDGPAALRRLRRGTLRRRCPQSAPGRDRAPVVGPDGGGHRRLVRVARRCLSATPQKSQRTVGAC